MYAIRSYYVFGQEVAAIDGVAAYVGGVVAPHGEHVVAALDEAPGAPKHEQGARDALFTAGFVMRQIDAGSGAIILAAGMDRCRVGEAADIVGNDRSYNFV